MKWHPRSTPERYCFTLKSPSTDRIEHTTLWQLQQPKLNTVRHDSQKGSSNYCKTWKPQQSTFKTRAVHIRCVEDKEALKHVFLWVLQPSLQEHFTSTPYWHFIHLPVTWWDSIKQITTKYDSHNSIKQILWRQYTFILKDYCLLRSDSIESDISLSIFWKIPLPPSFVYPEEWGSRFP